MAMDSIDQELILEAEDDASTIEFIKNYLPMDLKGKFSDDELYYFLDVIIDYYATSGVLDSTPDANGYIELDLETVVDYVIKQAHKDKMGDYDPEDIMWVVKGEMEYGESLEDA